jgi:transcriptional regulator with XRE-family HTH domain
MKGVTLNIQNVSNPSELKNPAAAIKELRTRLGITQTEFARKIDKTLNTVARYENQLKPGIEALVVCGSLALRSGFEDLAEVFRGAIIETLGSEIEYLMRWDPEGSPGSPSVRVPKELVGLANAFVRFLTAKDVSTSTEYLRQTVRRILEEEYVKSSGGWKKLR